jgi:uncharacterized protein with NAD-binding domain and iron-sulfur cluster
MKTSRRSRHGPGIFSSNRRWGHCRANCCAPAQGPGVRVTIYEREETFGGKARTFSVPENVPIEKIRNLPAEHGFRFLPDFYKHVGQTLSRIPYAQGRTVFNNLVEVQHAAYAQEGKAFFRFRTKQPKGIEHWLNAFRTMLENSSLGLRPHRSGVRRAQAPQCYDNV